MRAVLSIGSNRGDRNRLLAGVVAEFKQELIAVSSLYKTPPWGVVEQDDFLNAVLIVEVAGTPLELLKRGQMLEQQAQRVRLQKWGPRTLDVDIIQVTIDGEEVYSDNPQLRLPHPLAGERGFVLLPWLEVEPEATLSGIPAAELLEKLDQHELAAITRLGKFDV